MLIGGGEIQPADSARYAGPFWTGDGSSPGRVRRGPFGPVPRTKRPLEHGVRHRASSARVIAPDGGEPGSYTAGMIPQLGEARPWAALLPSFLGLRPYTSSNLPPTFTGSPAAVFQPAQLLAHGELRLGGECRSAGIPGAERRGFFFFSCPGPGGPAMLTRVRPGAAAAVSRRRNNGGSRSSPPGRCNTGVLRRHARAVSVAVLEWRGLGDRRWTGRFQVNPPRSEEPRPRPARQAYARRSASPTGTSRGRRLHRPPPLMTAAFAQRPAVSSVPGDRRPSHVVQRHRGAPLLRQPPCPRTALTLRIPPAVQFRESPMWPSGGRWRSSLVHKTSNAPRPTQVNGCKTA